MSSELEQLLALTLHSMTCPTATGPSMTETKTTPSEDQDETRRVESKGRGEKTMTSSEVTPERLVFLPSLSATQTSPDDDSDGPSTPWTFPGIRAPCPSEIPTPANDVAKVYEHPPPGPEPFDLTQALGEAQWKANNQTDSLNGLGPPILLQKTHRRRKDPMKVIHVEPTTPLRIPDRAVKVESRRRAASGGVIGEGYQGPRSSTPAQRVRLSPGERVDQSPRHERYGRSHSFDDPTTFDNAACKMYAQVCRMSEYESMCLSRPSERDYVSWVVSTARRVYGDLDADSAHTLHTLSANAYPQINEWYAHATPSRAWTYAVLEEGKGLLPKSPVPHVIGSMGGIEATSYKLNEALFESVDFLQPQPERDSARPNISRSNIETQSQNGPARSQVQRSGQEFQEGDFYCSQCGKHNFGRQLGKHCVRCNATFHSGTCHQVCGSIATASSQPAPPCQVVEKSRPPLGSTGDWVHVDCERGIHDRTGNLKWSFRKAKVCHFCQAPRHAGMSATVREVLDMIQQQSNANAVIPPQAGDGARPINARRSELFESEALRSPSGVFASFEGGLAWRYGSLNWMIPLTDDERDVAEYHEAVRQQSALFGAVHREDRQVGPQSEFQRDMVNTGAHWPTTKRDCRGMLPGQE